MVICLYFEIGFGVGVDVGEHKQSHLHPTCSGQTEGGGGVDIGEAQQFHIHLICSGQSEDGVEVDVGEHEQYYLHPTDSGQTGDVVGVEVGEHKQYSNLRNCSIHPFGVVSKTKGVNFYMDDTKSCSSGVIRLYFEIGFGVGVDVGEPK